MNVEIQIYCFAQLSGCQHATLCILSALSTENVTTFSTIIAVVDNFS